MINFHNDARNRKPSCHCRQVQKLLFEKAVPKKRGDNTSQDVIITPETLEITLNQALIVYLLRCECVVCQPVTRRTPPADDHALASRIAESAERRKLTAALAIAGGTFALRLLDNHRLDTISDAVRLTPLRDDLTSALYAMFKNHPAIILFQQEDGHTVSQTRTLFIKAFLQQLDKWATHLRVPTFQANNLQQHFHDSQNMPFLGDRELPFGRRDGNRKFYEFQIHETFCDARLTGRSLFRKQIDLPTVTARQEATQESDVLKVLKEIAHPNIIEVLFAFQEEQPPRLSLVFDYVPFDLERILFPGQRDARIGSRSPGPAPEKVEERFPGSKLDDWRWFGLLDIFDAVAAVHEPPLPSLQRDPKFHWLGAHFDIKPANIVVTATGKFMLTDFGLAYLKRFANEPEAETDFTITAGTAMYQPPPSYSRRKPEGTGGASDQMWWKRDYDVWSLACVASELLAYLVDGEDAPAGFRIERAQQDSSGFWELSDNTEVLKDAVSRRLYAYRNLRDPYLTRVADQILKMFSFTREAQLTVKTCQRELSAGVKIDREILQNPSDEAVAGPDTYGHLRDMRTSFSTQQIGSPLRCCLYLWANFDSRKMRLDVEFSGSNGETFVVPNWTKLISDEFLALSLSNPEMLYEDNRLRPNGLFLECAFRSMHDGFMFHFAKRRDYYHFFGAMTHQHVEIGSEFRFRRCKIKARGARFKSHDKWEASDGHLHVWRELRDDHYRRVYVERNTHHQTDGRSLRSDHKSSRGSSDTKVGTPTRAASIANPPVRYRLALYLRCHEGPSHALALVSLNHSSSFIPKFDLTNDQGAKMNLVKRDGQDIWGTIIQAPADATSAIDSKLGLSPGIPLSPEILTRSIQDSSGFLSVEVIFCSVAGKLQKHGCCFVVLMLEPQMAKNSKSTTRACRKRNWKATSPRAQSRSFHMMALAYYLGVRAASGALREALRKAFELEAKDYS